MAGSSGLHEYGAPSLSDDRVGNLKSLSYFPEYLSVTEESSIFEEICASKAGWKQVGPAEGQVLYVLENSHQEA